MPPDGQKLQRGGGSVIIPNLDPRKITRICLQGGDYPHRIVYDVSAEGHNKRDDSRKIVNVSFENSTLSVIFDNDETHYADLQNDAMPLKFSRRAIGLIRESINKYRDKHVALVKYYTENGQGVQSYLCDYCLLGWHVSELPPSFDLLMKKITPGEVIHNNIVASVVLKCVKLGCCVSLEVSNGQKKVDLEIDGTLVEVKTITGPYLLKHEPIQKLSRKIQHVFSDGFEQSSKDGCVIMGFWSKNVNDFLMNVWHDDCHSDLPEFIAGHKYFALQRFDKLDFKYVTNVEEHKINQLSDSKLLDGRPFLSIDDFVTLERSWLPVQKKISGDGFNMEITATDLKFITAPTLVNKSTDSTLCILPLRCVLVMSVIGSVMRILLEDSHMQFG